MHTIRHFSNCVRISHAMVVHTLFVLVRGACYLRLSTYRVFHVRVNGYFHAKIHDLTGVQVEQDITVDIRMRFRGLNIWRRMAGSEKCEKKNTVMWIETFSKSLIFHNRSD